MKVKKLLSLVLALVILLTTGGRVAAADELPYDTYNYDYREYIHYTPAAYIPEKTIRGLDLSFNGEPIGAFKTPQDMCLAPDGTIYIADTGNNRIVVLDNAMKNVRHIITTFKNGEKDDTFKSPYGVAVSEKGWVYIADQKNKRVVVLDETDTLMQIIDNPQSESLADNFIFNPMKVVVDYADRVYVIAQNMFEGVMVFESNGQFSNFFGTIEVSISLWEKFWRRIATKEERSNQRLYIPTEFTGIDIDPEGFVYASNIDANGIQGVRRLNPRGEDVIKKGQNENVGGDLVTGGNGDYAGPSQFTDVVYRDKGIYSCLDRKRGRIFTYDHEGNLLYIFGGLGTQEGTFTLPVAVEDIGGRITVLDATKGEILCFVETEYGRLINEAVGLRYDGDEADAVALWQRVLELDENNELANTGIGKAYLTAGDYEKAMYYLELGMAREYYSIAYKRYRNAILSENVGYVLTGVLVLLAGGLTVKMIRKKRRKGAVE
ncbi:MAG: gluconolactonase [Lachnospiraceae bacterium]|nr:gluconolactonase [Lachnospiraceae bacterium]